MTTLRKDLDPGGAAGVVPGTPGSPGSPAYCLDIPSSVPGYVLIFVIAGDGSLEIIPVSTTPITVITHECFPPVDAIPSTPPTDVPAAAAEYFVGWNSGAVSIATLTGDGMFQFSVPGSSVGVVTGFDVVHVGTSYAEIQFGIYCASGNFQIMENGVALTAPAPFVTSDVFTISRLQPEVMYFHNSTLVYTSLQPSSGTVFVDACLYFGGDEVVQ